MQSEHAGSDPGRRGRAKADVELLLGRPEIRFDGKEGDVAPVAAMQRRFGEEIDRGWCGRAHRAP